MSQLKELFKATVATASLIAVVVACVMLWNHDIQAATLLVVIAILLRQSV